MKYEMKGESSHLTVISFVNDLQNSKLRQLPRQMNQDHFCYVFSVLWSCLFAATNWTQAR